MRQNRGRADRHDRTCTGWLERNTRDVGDLAKPAVARAVLDALAVTKDGRSAAPSTVQRQRGVVVNLAEYAVERRLLTRTRSPPCPEGAEGHAGVDRRVVVNPDQARALLTAVADEKPSGDRLVAFFGAMYYAALRPAEALMLRKANLALPSEGWGELLLESSTPVAGPAWTDSGRRREERQLKHRARGETRFVPCAPALTALLHAHLSRSVTDLTACCSAVCGAASWPRAPTAGCGARPEKSRCPPTSRARRWPAALRPPARCRVDVAQRGVPATQVAEWAGHSVAVLHQIYAKCIVGQEDAARRRIDAVLGDS